MSIYLPIAEIPVNIYYILLLGIAGGVLSGLFGIGGGFLVTPMLIFMGIPPYIAVATSSNQIVATSASAFFSYYKNRKVDIKMGSIMLFGGVVGGYLGIEIFRSLSNAGLIDFIIYLIYVIFLSFVSYLMFIDGYKKIVIGKIPSSRISVADGGKKDLSKVEILKKLPLQTQFIQSKIKVSIFVPISIGVFSGILASMLGIGGGIILVPAMMYLLKMPSSLVVGTSLYQMLLTAIFVTFFHAVINNAIDIILAILLIIGGVIGAQIGIKFTTKVSQGKLRILLAVIFMIIALRLSVDLFIKPAQIFTVT
jgi:uncharacterized membrane protein YfcA